MNLASRLVHYLTLVVTDMGILMNTLDTDSLQMNEKKPS